MRKRPTGVAWLALLVAAILWQPAEAEASSPRVVAAHAIVERLQAGKPVVLDHATVRGTLDLDRLGTVRGAFKCRRWRFTGSLIARKLSFRGPVDLNGSTVAGSVLMRGSTFRGPALFGLGRAPETRFGGRVDFAFARFEDVVSFRDAILASRANFFDATFLGTAFFGAASFGKRASFEDADFGSDARFTGAEFKGDASFARASFHSAFDCRICHFGAAARFFEVDLGRA